MKAVSADNSSPLKAWVRALEMTAPIERNPSVILPVMVEKLAGQFGPALALIGDDECMTYRELADQSNRYARWALEQGIDAGRVVCLMMHNCPQYVAIWLGITRIGGIVSLVNTNLAGGALAHAINIVAPSQIIVGAELAGTVVDILPRLSSRVKTWVIGESAHEFPRIDNALDHYAGTSLSGLQFRAPSISDLALYIYTSGTTGFPKAANVSHFRLMQWSYWFAGLMNTQSTDRMLNCLPMYHSVGGVAAIFPVIINGGSVVIRPRFSSSRFWDDVASYDCTLFQYIGELCRYLVNAPPHPRETDHRLRLCCGNGLRAGVWDEFKGRFRIPQILEFYASTEGNVSLYNCEGKPGAIGRVPSFLAHRSNLALVKCDASTEAPLRNNDGFCARCQPGEIGEAIGKILGDESDYTTRFEGYADSAASERKILRDVFTHGDVWFRTGDLMRRDEKGYYYFVDRIGDTFRWKGENVATVEVASKISAYPHVLDAVVYGVTVPGTEGRAGMAAVVADHGFELSAFHKYLNENLPDYARPLFLRLCDVIEVTATFKSKAHQLKLDGYNPAATTDNIFFNDRLQQAFVKLDSTLFENIQAGMIRL
ncbi:MAG TPA: long-chain-acyl-CoA synthetase [Candidatus Binataceae bacterium]|nr:long-chain-acyl-CoA synthetase [Candidatus Binataceae bacterium]